MVCSSAVLRAQGQSSCGEEERHGGEPDLLWLAELTGAHIGLPPLCQDPEDRCSIWENLVSLVDFQCPGFPLTAEELCDYIDIRRTPVASSAACTSTSTVSAHRAGAEPPQLPGDVDYKSNAHLKPPYSYATLICMAMQASKKPKITLAAICKWISDNFAYFRPADPAWQSAIRHNLCINKRFIKVPRQKGEPGRGAFWKLHPRYAERLKSSTRRERRTLGEHTQPASSKRTQQEARHGLSPTALARSSLSKLELSAELQQLLQEFEEFGKSQEWNGMEGEEGQQHKQPQPMAPTEGSWLCSCASGSQQEQGELTELKGDTDWEALLNSHAEDETLMATAFLEADWQEETREKLCSCVALEQGAENTQASLPGGDGMDWDFLSHFS